MTNKRHSRRYKKAGSPYSSASSYSEYVNGSENAQYNRVFNTSGPYANIPGNISIGAQGQNSHQQGTPSAQNLALIQKAGKSRRRRKRGGLWGSVINQAIVPFSLLGMQQSYKRKRYGGKKTTQKRRRY